MVLFLTGGFKPQAFENVNQILEAKLLQHLFSSKRSRFDTIDIYAMEIDNLQKLVIFQSRVNLLKSHIKLQGGLSQLLYL